MKAKEKELLALLYKNNDRFLTSQNIADQLGISERTVRTYLKRLTPVIESKGASIEAKQGKGIRMQAKDSTSIEKMISPNKLESLLEDESIDNAQDRKDYIFQKLLLENDRLDPYDFALELCVSDSTIKKDFTNIRPMLDSYNLRLCQNADGQFFVSGDERNKRALIMDYFFRNGKFTSIREYIDHSGYFDDVPSETLLMIILDETQKEKLHLSDIMIQNVMMHLALSIKRIKNGLPLEHMSDDFIRDDSREKRAASAMIKRLSSEIGMDFPKEEEAYLALHMAAKSADCYADQNTNDLILEIRTVLAEMALDGYQDLTQDELLQKSLLDHLAPMLTRVRQGIRQANPLTESIKKDHPEVFDRVKAYFSHMRSLLGQKVSDDEWAYLALHIMAAAERAEENRKLQVLVICATGYGSSQLLHSRLMKHFSNSIHIVQETGYFSLTDDILKGIDLIISSVNMGSVIFGVPFLHVSVFLTDEDVASIQRFVDKHMGTVKIDQTPALSKDVQSLVFHRYFSKKHFLIFDRSYDAETIVDRLVEMMSEGESESFATHMKDQIKLRTKLGNVAFSDTIAVPHPAMPLSEVAGFAVGIVPEGVYWDEEHPSIRFIILMCPSHRSNEGLKYITKALVDFIDETQLQSNVLNNPTFEQFEIALKPLIK